MLSPLAVENIQSKSQISPLFFLLSKTHLPLGSTPLLFLGSAVSEHFHRQKPEGQRGGIALGKRESLV